jgi:hypothetical protein
MDWDAGSWIIAAMGAVVFLVLLHLVVSAWRHERARHAAKQRRAERRRISRIAAGEKQVHLHKYGPSAYRSNDYPGRAQGRSSRPLNTSRHDSGEEVIISNTAGSLTFDDVRQILNPPSCDTSPSTSGPPDSGSSNASTDCSGGGSE